MSIPSAILRLLDIVHDLRRSFPQRRFTLDGRLVGDLGEVMAEQAYDLTLFRQLTKHHDARAGDGRLVQIKSTMQATVTFPVDHTPEHLLATQIHRDGTFTEVFNGPGAVARRAVQNRRPTKTNLHSVPVAALSRLNREVPDSARVPMRTTTSAGGGRFDGAGATSETRANNALQRTHSRVTSRAGKAHGPRHAARR